MYTTSLATQRRGDLAGRLSARYASGLCHVLACMLFGALFLYLNYIPLWHTDLWGHISYGHWILANHSLPSEDPFMPLAEGMRVIDTSWLAQLIFAQLEAWGGAEWLSNLYALTVLVTYVVLCHVFVQQTGRLGLALGGVLLFLVIGWSRHAIIRTEVFGSLSFAVLLWLLVRDGTGSLTGTAAARSPSGRRPWSIWLALPALFCLWANLHGSFVCGLVLLGCVTFGHGAGVLCRSRSVRGLLEDKEFRRLVIFSELAVAATWINPYGMDLLIYAVGFPGNENLRDIMEWYPLALMSPTGYQFIFSIALSMILLRHSRRPIRPADVLLFGVFAAAAVSGIRMIGWYAMVAVAVMMPHLGDVSARIWARRPTSRCWSFSVVCLVTIWVSFALSGFGRAVLGGNPRTPERLYSQYTPHQLTGYLRAHPPEGQIWNPQMWGDWLAWNGPPNTKVFMTTMIHLAPRQVWRDYMRVAGGRRGWEEVLDRYGVTTVVVDKKLHLAFASKISRASGWTVRYEDDLGMVLGRRHNPGKTKPSPTGEAYVRRQPNSPLELTPDDRLPDHPIGSPHHGARLGGIPSRAPGE